MNGSNCGIFAYMLLLLISVTKCEDLCAGEESTVIKTVGESMGINLFIFIKNSQDVGILQQIKLLPESSYYVAVASSEELDDILNDEVRQEKYFDKRMILITKEKLNFTSAFEKLLDSSVAWIVFPESLEELEYEYIPVNSNFYIVHCTSDFVVLDKVYHLKRGLRLIVNNVEIWPKGGEEALSGIYENLEIDFKGMTLNVLHLSLENECKNKTIHVLKRMECFQQEIIQVVAEKLNVTKGKNAVQARKKLTDVYGEGVLTVTGQCQNWFAKFRSGNFDVEDSPQSGRPVEADKDAIKALVDANNHTRDRMNKMFCPERLYPYNYPNGSLSEMFEILKRGEADISSGSYIISGHRMMSYDFAWPVFTTKSMMYIKFENGKSSWRAYLRPVSVSVWKVIVSLILLTGFLLHVFHRYHEGNLTLQFSLIPEFLQFLYLSLQVYCNQGVHNIPRWYSNRIVFILSFLLSTSLYQAYSGFLISSLTVATPFIPFHDMHGFFHDGTYKIITLRRGFHNYVVKTLLKDIGSDGHKFILNDLPETSEFGVRKLCTIDRITYIEFRENIVQHVIPCRIIEFPQPILYQSIGIGLPKKSPLREILNHQVNVLRGTGILHRMRKYLLSFVKLSERETSRDDFLKVSLGHVVSVFFVIGAGITLSIIILFTEFLFYFLNNPKVTRINKLNYSSRRKIPVRKRRPSFGRELRFEQYNTRSIIHLGKLYPFKVAH